MKGILFSGPMVRAIWERRKTVTRRVMKHPMNPPYRPGEVVYVKETFRQEKYGGLWLAFDHAEAKIEYLADGHVEYFMLVGDDKAKFRNKKSPSIFMPEWASRLHLEIVSVRPERLICIENDDVTKEGVDNLPDFVLLWNKIYKGGFAWEENPWVWVITFKQCQSKEQTGNM